ncbi:hypothetical protein ACFV3E_06490 [Streptomyces sp. NPDC059718]
MGLWAYAVFYGVGAAVGQGEPDVGEAARDLTAAAVRVQEIYDCAGLWPDVQESVRRITYEMLHEGSTALQRQESWSCRVGDVELTLFPMPDRVAPVTARPYGIPEQAEH